MKWQVIHPSILNCVLKEHMRFYNGDMEIFVLYSQCPFSSVIGQGRFHMFLKIHFLLPKFNFLQDVSTWAWVRDILDRLLLSEHFGPL